MPIRMLVAAALAPALGAVMGLFALTRPPPPSEPRAPPPATAPRPVATTGIASFEYRWNALAELRPAQPPTKIEPPAPPQTAAREVDREGRVEVASGAGASVQTLPPPPTLRPQDVCARYGGHREDYTRENHRYWRCVYPHRASAVSSARTR